MTNTTLDTLIALPDPEAALMLEALLHSLEASYRRGFSFCGLILVQFEQRRLWALLSDPATSQPYTSMDRWILTAAPYSYRSCYSAKEAIKRLLPDIPADKLADIPRCNILTLVEMSSSVRREPNVIEAAMSMREPEFTAKIEAEFPGQHLEAKRSMSFRPSRSQHEVIQRAIDLAIGLGTCATREEVLEMWASGFSTMHQDELTGSGVAAEDAMGLEPHQERVVIEKMELAEKIEKLHAFIDGESFLKVPMEEQTRLGKQLSIMTKYSEILGERIAAF